MNRSRCRRDNLHRRPGQRASSAAHACAATPRSTVSPAALPRQGASTSGARLRRRAVSAPATSTSWPNRHSAVLALNSRCGTRRGFLPRGLCDTCPQLAAVRGAAACAGRCPTTLNRGGRSGSGNRTLWQLSGALRWMSAPHASELQEWVVRCRPRTSAIRWSKLRVNFPAGRSRARPAQADPEATLTGPFGIPQSSRSGTSGCRTGNAGCGPQLPCRTAPGHHGRRLRRGNPMSRESVSEAAQAILNTATACASDTAWSRRLVAAAVVSSTSAAFCCVITSSCCTACPTWAMPLRCSLAALEI